MYTPINIKRSTKYGNNYWETYSPKIKRNIRLFSDLEYDNWILIETNPLIINFCEQPLRIQYQFEDKIVESIFDMWICYKDNREEFLEVKYSSELNPLNPKAKRSIKQTTIQNEWCKNNGFNYNIKTELEIRNNIVYLNNMKQILGFIKTDTYPSEIDRFYILKIIENQKIKIRDILQEFTIPSPSRMMSAISWLIYEGYINTNIDKKIFDYETEVWINGK